VTLPRTPTAKPRSSTRAFERTAKRGADQRAAASSGQGKAKEKMILRLYVAGTSTKSMRAIQNAKEICDTNLAGRYELAVIDIFQQPALAKDDQILAVPTLIKKLPAPLRRFIGDLSDRDVVLVGLDLKRK
jgi:circadian clock protein KaiB